jgi:RNA polymerase sigma-70 factor, ECF subfamily
VRSSEARWVGTIGRRAAPQSSKLTSERCKTASLKAGDHPLRNPIVPTSTTSRVSPDATLVQRFVHRDVGAFENLYDRHRRLVYSVALRILQQTATAEEVVQDIFLQLWRNAGSYDVSRGAFTAWLLTLARNKALDQLRLKSERQRRREEQTDVFPPFRITPGFEIAFDAKRHRECVRAAVGTLQYHQRRTIELAYFEGLTHSEIAAKLKEPLGTVKTWIRQGVLHLKEGLQAKEGRPYSGTRSRL